jgi:hypothetical protein
MIAWNHALQHGSSTVHRHRHRRLRLNPSALCQPLGNRCRKRSLITRRHTEAHVQNGADHALLTPAVSALALVIHLLVTAAAAPLLAAAIPLQGHATGQAADKVLHLGATDQSTLLAIGSRKALCDIANAHSGKATLTAHTAAAKVALPAADTAADGSTAKKTAGCRAGPAARTRSRTAAHRTRA